MHKEWKTLIEGLDYIYIYGAGKYGKRALMLINEEGFNHKVLGFAVTEKKNNPSYIKNVPVVDVDGIKEKEIPILVAVSQAYQKEIQDNLQRLEFKNVIDISGFVELDRAEIDEVQVDSISCYLEKQEKVGCYTKYAIITSLLAIEEYYNKNNIGYKLYDKLVSMRCTGKNSNITLEWFKTLIESYEKWGYDTDAEILVGQNGAIENPERAALAIYNKKAYIRVRFSEREMPYAQDDVIYKIYTQEERNYIEKRYERYRLEIERDSKRDEELLIEEIFCMLGKEEQFGRGEFYQSLDGLGINGQRPTDTRIKKYELRKYIEGKRVLDIGCNCGFLDITIAPMVKHITGVEYNPNLVNIANRVTAYLGYQHVEFLTGDFKKFVTDEKYDVVFSFAVHHWIGLEPKAYCQKVVSMMSNNSFLFFESQNVNIDVKFEEYCSEFENLNLTRVKEDEIYDDEIIRRKYVIFHKK